MKVWKYKQIMPEVILAKHSLIETKNIVDLVGKSVDYIYTMLLKTPYQVEISAIPAKQLGPISLENALLTNYIRTYEEIIDHSPKDINFFLSTSLMKFEVDNVKAMLRAKWAKISVGEAVTYIVPVGRLDEVKCRNILESSNSVNNIVELLKDLEYGSVLKEALTEYEETESLLPLEVALDKYIYRKIWRATGKLRGLDKKIARTVLGIEIDSTNVKIILRCKAMKISEQHIRNYIIPVSDVFGDKELEDAIKATNIESSIESLLAAAKLAMVRDYQYLLTDVMEEYNSSESLSKLEMVLDRGLLKTCFRILKRRTQFFNIALILAFLKLKWFETRNLRAIIIGAENKIPPDKVKNLLIIPLV